MPVYAGFIHCPDLPMRRFAVTPIALVVIRFVTGLIIELIIGPDFR